MAMTIAVLPAGNGYRYLTAQVARADETRTTTAAPGVRGPVQLLESYYQVSGNPPGQWMGAGADHIGLSGEVTEPQLFNLFGLARHPEYNALFKPTFDQLLAEAGGPSAYTPRLGARLRRQVEKKLALGRPYPVYRTVTERVADRLAALERAGNPATPEQAEAITAEEKERGQKQAAAGYGLVFSPVKSVSVLWGLGDDATREAVEAAHHEAIADVVAWIEKDVAVAREGRAGIAYVDVHGVLAASFTHRTSRAGEPDLHTHVVLANRVQTREGDRWLALDGATLYRAVVAASERYNSLLEDKLRAALGVEFEARPNTDVAPIREIKGIPQRLLDVFSARRRIIQARYDRLVAAYLEKHGSMPDKATQLQLGQQAATAGRKNKDPGSTAQGERDLWARTALAVLGAEPGPLLASVVGAPVTAEHALTSQETGELGQAVLAAVIGRRSSWTIRHLQAEAQRATRGLHTASATGRESMVDAVVNAAVAGSVQLTPPEIVDPPAALLRADGMPVFRAPASPVFTARVVLDAEARLVAAARTRGPAAHPAAVAAALAAAPHLAPDQVASVRRLALEGTALGGMIGPAGTGKTTTLTQVVAAWRASGLPVIGLAPHSNGAAVLAEKANVEAENIAKWQWETTQGRDRRAIRLAELQQVLGRTRRPASRRKLIARMHELAAENAKWSVRPGQLVIVDEAGTAGTLVLDQLRAQVTEAGGRLLLTGDWRQLSAIEAGGALRLLDSVGALVHLRTVFRLRHEWEREASLRMRVGDVSVVALYQENDRIVTGTAHQIKERLFANWAADERAGLASLMMTVHVTDVRDLNARARQALIDAGSVQPGGVILASDMRASVGDRIVARHVDRRLKFGRRDWVRNGMLFTVEALLAGGGMRVRHRETGCAVVLPAAYVASHVELGYATTVNRSLGMDVDTSHSLLVDGMTREQLYTAGTRGADSNRFYAETPTVFDLDGDYPPPDEPATGMRILAQAVAREGAELSAVQTMRVEQDKAGRLSGLVPALDFAQSLTRADAYAALLRRLLPAEHAEAAVTSPAYATLRHALAELERAGYRAEAILPIVVGGRGLADDVDDPARTLYHRVVRYATRTRVAAPEPGLPDWLPLRILAESGGGPLVDYARASADAIRARARSLAAGVLAAPPAWAAQLGAVPTGDAGRQRHHELAGAIAVYRDLYDVNTADALGPRPSRSRQETIWVALNDALAGRASSPPATPSRQGLVDLAAQLSATRATLTATSPTPTPSVVATSGPDLEFDDTGVDVDALETDVDGPDEELDLEL
ncbi:MobF family relaxase [Longispora sp. NPDC051575]|uniref:MobF family relaxase n=1 Tax=Longispora sp. NPDC051575 TaxID=3154943 RepID=UPI003426EE69